ncbi:hypothetical protein [Colwellia piezophila]|uniref:hypothetical protein n=1 Tax=Colwellia piezophila TaxID=211668 RepID=UPI0003810127|nr:hypothetical protein [Colwellia piezophila]
MLFFHIIAGVLVLLCGFTALFSGKGLKLHKQAGNIFFIAMVTLSLSAAYLEVKLGDFPIMGVLSLYFASTSWASVKRQAGKIGRFEYAAFFCISIVAITFYKWAWDITYNGQVLEGTLPLAGYFIFGTFAAFAATLDLTMLIRGGVIGSHRIARHLWRMCFAFIMAILSFLDQDIFPDFIVDTGLLWLTLLLPLLMMFYWLLRLPFNHWKKREPSY